MNTQPGYAIPIDFNDYLTVVVTSLVVDIEAVIRVRTILPDNSIQVHLHVINPPAAGGSNVFRFRLDSGFLIGVSIFSTSTEPFFGELSCIVRVDKGGFTTPQGSHVLISGYVDDGIGISWPEMPPVMLEEGNGGAAVISVANPGAGLNFTHTVPADVIFMVRSVSFRLVTAVAVATRRAIIILDDGSVLIQHVVASNTQAASLTYDYTISNIGYAETLLSSRVSLSFGVVRLPAGCRIRSAIENMQAADVISNIRITGDRWQTPSG